MEMINKIKAIYTHIKQSPAANLLALSGIPPLLLMIGLLIYIGNGPGGDYVFLALVVLVLQTVIIALVSAVLLVIEWRFKIKLTNNFFTQNRIYDVVFAVGLGATLFLLGLVATIFVIACFS